MKLKRLLPYALIVGTLSVVGGSGCFVHGRMGAEVVVDRPPPPPRYVHVSVRPGFIWVRGYWQWNGVDYVWREGYYERARPGHLYVQGRWVRRGGRHVWQPARWKRSGPRARGYAAPKGKQRPKRQKARPGPKPRRPH